ncbi:MAG: hypothetical protein JWR70_1001 [Modestobacter sp.]|nr:hypothetical protein [Modestobacter sp.]
MSDLRLRFGFLYDPHQALHDGTARLDGVCWPFGSIGGAGWSLLIRGVDPAP